MIGWSIGPRITKKNGKLVVRTAMFWRILTLGLDSKIMTVDPVATTIHLKRRLFWFFPSERTLRFDEIKRINYSHSDGNIFTAMGATGDSIDRYMVRLELRRGGTVHLFNWTGDGGFQVGAGRPEWMHWKDLTFDAVGSQAKQSKVFVTLLSELTGAPLV